MKREILTINVSKEFLEDLDIVTKILKVKKSEYVNVKVAEIINRELLK